MLTFGLVDYERLLSIDELRALPKERRPAVDCAACGSRLIAHLGDQVAHHFKHAATVDCYAASAEGALHLDAKLRLHRFLKGLAAKGGSVVIDASCDVCDDGEPREFVELRAGDEVVMERQLDRLRPDVSARRGGQPLAAFEVVATHKCDSEKWATLRARGVPVLESSAESIVAWDREGPARGPIPFDEVAPRPPLFECRSCTAERLENFNTPRIEPVAWCLVHRFLQDGRRMEHGLTLSRTFLRGTWVSASLVDERGQMLKSWEESIAARPEDLLLQARAVAREWARQLRTKRPLRSTTTAVFVRVKMVSDPLRSGGGNRNSDVG